VALFFPQSLTRQFAVNIFTMQCLFHVIAGKTIREPGLIVSFSLKPGKIIYSMEDKDLKKFSLTALFFVTGICFFVFGKALWIIDGTRLPLFTRIGIIAILLGSLNMIRSLLQKTKEE
jgi:hypothetical protein